MSTPVEEKQAARVRVLLAYYDLSDGEPRVFLNPEQVEQRTGLSAEDVAAARRFLIRGGLVEERGTGGLASISQEGILEAERIKAEIRRHSRSTVLAAAYSLSKASIAAAVNTLEIRQKTGLDESTIRDAVLLLNQTGQVKILGSNPGLVFALTAEGIHEVESARAPASAAPVAPAVMNFNAPVASVQTGAGSVAHVQQVVGFDASQVSALIEEMRRSIPSDRPHLREAVDDLADEVSKPQAKPSKIRAFLTAAATYGRDIAALVGAAKEIAKLFGVDLP